MFELVGRDYFLSDLDDPGLCIRILDQQPKLWMSAWLRPPKWRRFRSLFNPLVGVEVAPKGWRPLSIRRREKRVRLVSPSRESETDKKIKVLEEIVEKLGQELKKFRQASKNSNKENVRQSNAPSENASPPQLVYVPYPSVPFGPSFVANGVM